MMEFKIELDTTKLNPEDYSKGQIRVSQKENKRLSVFKAIRNIKFLTIYGMAREITMKRVWTKEAVVSKDVFYISKKGTEITISDYYIGKVCHFMATMIYFGENGYPYDSKIYLYGDRNSPNVLVVETVPNYSWYVGTSIVFSSSYKDRLSSINFYQSEEELFRIIEKKDKYLSRFLQEKKQHPILGIICPKIEILYKAGYKFAEEIVDGGKDFSIKQLRGLCNERGTTPRNILRVPRYALSEIKKSEDLERCHFIRLVSGLHNISEKEFWWILDHYTERKELEMFSIHDATQRDRRLIATFGGDIRFPYIWYLETTQYLSKKNGEDHYWWASHIIFDYKRMCSELGVRFDKTKEYIEINHDMLSERFKTEQEKKREERLKIEEEKYKEILERNEKFNYSGTKFFIRTVQGNKDLLDEATQQHNCVASYWDRVRRGETRIFFMRKLGSPEKSYITVELTNGNKINQAYLKGNCPISNQEEKDFLRDWRKFVIEKTKELQKEEEKN